MNFIRCKNCKSKVEKTEFQLICKNCNTKYNISDEIIIIEDNKDINLHTPSKLLDYYKLRDKRLYNDKYIKSDVEYYARLHSIDFSNFHAELLDPYIKGSRVVDLGSGQLPYINHFNSEIKEYYAIDLDINALKIAFENFTSKFSLYLIQNGVLNTPINDNSADIVISSEVIEHIEKPHDYLKEIYRICKPGGIISLSTPCAAIFFYPDTLLFLLKRPRRWFKQVNCHKYWEETLQYHPSIQPRHIKKWVEDAGFQIIKHKTRLIYYSNKIRLIWRLFSLLEKLGFKKAGRLFYQYILFWDNILNLNIPILKWMGTRQFLLCKKV